MSEITQETITPSEDGNGSFGSLLKRWGQGHFANLYKGGKEVAVLDGSALTNATASTPSSGAEGSEIVNAEWVRAFTEAFRENLALLGVPTAPTPDPGDDSTRIATTGWVQAIAAALKTLLEQRSNHTGQIASSVISDFASAVAALPAGTKAHDRNADTQLIGAGGVLTADVIAAHLSDAARHFEIDDTAGEGDLDKVLSADRVIALIAAAVGEGIGSINLDAVTGAGALAALNVVVSAVIAAQAVTPSKLLGGPANNAVANGRFYGFDADGNPGFHLPVPKLGAAPSAGQSLLVSDDGIYVKTGDSPDSAAAGDDARFPTANQKSALAGAAGSPGAGNKYLTESWATARSFDAGDIDDPSPDETPGLVSPAALAEALMRRSEVGEIDLDTLTPSAAPGLVSALELTARFLTPSQIEPIQDTIETLVDKMEGKLDAAGFAEQWEDGTVFDGDKLDVDYPPEHYAPRSLGNPHAADTGDLAAHCAGIDDKLGQIAATLADIEADGVPADISGSDVVRTATNYTPADSTVIGHFAGVDTALGARLTAATAIDPAKFHADKLHVHWTPTNYTPTNFGTGGEAADAYDLTAHLKGIDNRLYNVANGLVNPMTTAGDMIYRGVSGPVRLPKGTSGQVLRMVDDLPAWANPPEGTGGSATMPYERQVWGWSTELETGDKMHLFGAPVSGIITMVEIESSGGYGSAYPPTCMMTLNDSATGPVMVPTTSCPQGTDGAGTNISGWVGRFSVSIPVSAGKGVGIVIADDGTGNPYAMSAAKGLRVVVWFEAL